MPGFLFALALQGLYWSDSSAALPPHRAERLRLSVLACFNF